MNYLTVYQNEQKILMVYSHCHLLSGITQCSGTVHDFFTLHVTHDHYCYVVYLHSCILCVRVCLYSGYSGYSSTVPTAQNNHNGNNYLPPPYSYVNDAASYQSLTRPHGPASNHSSGIHYLSLLLSHMLVSGCCKFLKTF